MFSLRQRICCLFPAFATLVTFLTIDIRWVSKSLPSAGRAIISYAHSASCAVLCSRWHPRPPCSCVYKLSPRQLQCVKFLYGIFIADNHFQRLQTVQNAAARLVTGCRRSGHIKPVLRSLHWLPVRHRVTFKMATLVHKCLNGKAPTCTWLPSADRLVIVAPASRSAKTWKLNVPRARSTYGDRSLSQVQASGTTCLLSFEIRHYPVNNSRNC